MGLFGKRKTKSTDAVTKLINNSSISLKTKVDVHSDGTISGIPQEFIEEITRFGYKPDPKSLRELFDLSENVKNATNDNGFMRVDYNLYDDNQSSYRVTSDVAALSPQHIKVPQRRSKLVNNQTGNTPTQQQKRDIDDHRPDNKNKVDKTGQKVDIKVPPRRRLSVLPKTEDEIIKTLKSISNNSTTAAKAYINWNYINQGGSGKVYSAECVKKGQQVALKVMDFKVQPKKELLVQEILIMRDICHPNLVNFIECFFEENTLIICMEYLNGGALTKVCQSIEMTEDMISFITDRSIRGLVYLHGKKIIHRDLKSDNILLDLNGGVKIADFGFCAKLHNDSEKRMTQVGTPYWMPPELIKKEPHDFRADTWSMGIVLFEMYAGDPPFFDDNPITAMYKISRLEAMPPFPCSDTISKSGLDILNKMLTVDTKLRPLLKDLQGHPFLRVGDSLPIQRFTEVVQTALDQP